MERIIPKISPEDLKDPTLTRLNSVLDLISRQLVATQGGTGPIKFLDTITAKDVIVTRRDKVNEENQAITYGEAKGMFSIPAIQEALQKREQFGIPVASFIEKGDPNRTIYDTHANRATYVAEDYKGWLYYESDRTVAYASLDTGGGVFAWRYVAGAHEATKANIPIDLGANDVGFVFYATDWKIYYKWSGTAFLYRSGTYSNTLANKPTLTTNDIGFLFEATDYKHIWQWSGTAWAWAPGENGSGYVCAALGTAPTGGLWGICDGVSSVYVSQADTTLVMTAVPDLVNNTFIQGGTYSGATLLATYATWETTAKTDAESTHTHAVDPPNTTSTSAGAHTHSVSGNTGSVGDSPIMEGTGATTNVTSGHSHSVSITTDDPGAHTHDVNIASFDSAAGSSHYHTLSTAVAQLKKFSESNGGLPDRVRLAFYLRR